MRLGGAADLGLYNTKQGFDDTSMAKEGQGESCPTSGSEFESDFCPESGEGEGEGEGNATRECTINPLYPKQKVGRQMFLL